jgi:MbtH protein
MASDELDENRIYKVVVNDEEQYSIWFADRDQPTGWRAVGKEGPKEECLAYINKVWTDMRPLSLRGRMEMEETGKGQAHGLPGFRRGGAASRGRILPDGQAQAELKRLESTN